MFNKCSSGAPKADVEFLWWMVVVLVGGGGVQSHFCVQPNCCVEVVLLLGL